MTPSEALGVVAGISMKGYWPRLTLKADIELLVTAVRFCRMRVFRSGRRDTRPDGVAYVTIDWCVRLPQ